MCHQYGYRAIQLVAETISEAPREENQRVPPEDCRNLLSACVRLTVTPTLLGCSRWIRSSVSSGTRRRPRVASGQCGAIVANRRCQGMIAFISSRNVPLPVFLLRFTKHASVTPSCFIGSGFGFVRRMPQFSHERRIFQSFPKEFPLPLETNSRCTQ